MEVDLVLLYSASCRSRVARTSASCCCALRPLCPGAAITIRSLLPQATDASSLPPRARGGCMIVIICARGGCMHWHLRGFRIIRVSYTAWVPSGFARPAAAGELCRRRSTCLSRWSRGGVVAELNHKKFSSAVQMIWSLRGVDGSGILPG